MQEENIQVARSSLHTATNRREVHKRKYDQKGKDIWHIIDHSLPYSMSSAGRYVAVSHHAWKSTVF